MGNLQKRYYGSCFFVLQPKKHHLYSCASVDGSTVAKKDYAGTGIYVNAFFGLKTVVNQKSVNLGMISARHNRQSFNKVTCPYNINSISNSYLRPPTDRVVAAVE